MQPEIESMPDSSAKPFSGIFWVITNDLSLEALSLLSLDSNAPPTSSRGDSHTHKTAWSMREALFSHHPLYRSHIKRHEFDYYPRGRVELRERSGNIIATIWLNPDIHHPSIIDAIENAFSLSGFVVVVKEDHSRHYCHKLYDE